jgi:hypothetical protein
LSHTHKYLRVIALLALTISAAMPAPSAEARPTAKGTCPQLKALIKEVGLPPVFLEIAYRESRCTPQAVGWNYRKGSNASMCKSVPFRQYLKTCAKHIRSYDSGLWQINSGWVSVTKAICGKGPRDGALFEPRCNARVAKYLYDNGGLGHWRATSGS